MSSPSVEDLLLRYEGHIVPRSFNAGFITLSYVVSLIGAACTLELLNRRTSHKGKFNHLLLVSSAVAMGGIAIWCMHFIGNRALDLGNGEPELQIAYSSGFTALSFFVPIAVLLAAFVAIGTNNVVSWWRVSVGGILAGAAICGMHYLGNNSIDNYVCMYNPLNVVGSALIAVAASMLSLALFFVFRAAWTNTWWKRAVCAVVLAGAVSGMHWCAATGTEYQLVSLSPGNNELSRNTTVIVVIVLSFCACSIMAGVAIYTARVMRRYANKAQQVVLAAAVFDPQGRILVNPDGLLPSEKITDTFLEKNASDTFGIAHPLFHWMFRASRNWSSVATLVSGMANHLTHLPRATRDRDSRVAIELVDEQGDMVANYDVILRELFCVAAQGLADKMKEQLTSVGILWDEILPTGGGNERPQKSSHGEASEDLAEKGIQQRRNNQFGRGSLMFLVRQVQTDRDVARLEAAGYRFAELRQVSGIIGSSMQIKCWDFESRLRSMAGYAQDESQLEPGVHLGFFGIRARVGSYGFDVLVRQGARNLLPSVQMPLSRLETWQEDLLQELDGMTVVNSAKRLEALKRMSPREMLFASQLFDGLESLRAWIDDPVFDEALLSPQVVTLPARSQDAEHSARQHPTTMIAFRLVIPIHVKVSSVRCEFVPLNFFKIHQLVDHDGMHQLAFAQAVHREFAPIAQSVPLERPAAILQNRQRKSFASSPRTSRFRRLGRSGSSYAVDGDGNPIPTAIGRSSSPTHSNETGSTLKLWPGRRNSDNNSAGSSYDAPPPAYASPDSTPHATTFGGIMVSEEIRVEIHEAGELSPLPGQTQRRTRRLPRLLSRSGNGSQQRYDSESGATQRATMVTSGGGAGIGVGVDDSRHGAPNDGTIEMKMLSEVRSNVHTGAGLQISNIEVEQASEVPTFVDELFTICIDGR
ncbi:Signaling protein YkoW like [Verticillium longisporum]|uniref:Signaling protein YkoW like n=1 Tax=Verticillium longisporum TaxID=100787 RepID=A0A8I2Z7A9_VERLO|nr:Signaling protein YkoW like [Verticillium longisporum]